MTRIVILDDQADAAEGLASALRVERPELDVSAPKVMNGDRPDIDAMGAALQSRPDVLIVDPIWQSKHYDAPVIISLKNALTDIRWSNPAKTYILSGYRFAEDTQKKWPNTWNEKLGVWLNVVDVIGKPIEAKTLLSIVLPNPILQVNFDIRDLKTPARILDKKTSEILGTNDAWWWAANRPRIAKGSIRQGQFLVEKKSGKDGVLTTYGITASKSLEAAPNSKRELVLQLAYELRSTQSRSKYDFLKALFDSICESGITHMRYYERLRVPQSDDKSLAHVGLVHWFPDDGYPKLSGKKQDRLLFPPAEYLYRDIVSHLDQEDRSNKFVKESSTGAPTLEGESYFNDLVDTAAGLEHVRVPVLRGVAGSPRYYAQALIVIDKRGAEPASQSFATELDWLEAPLLGACEEIRRLISNERQAYMLKNTGLIRRAFRDLAADTHYESRPGNLANTFLELAIKVSEAQEGVVYWSAHPERAPNLMAWRNCNRARPRQWPSGRPIRDNEPISELNNPVSFKAWTTGEPQFHPRYMAGDKAKVQSRIAIPLRAGNRLFGVLGLMHSQPMHFWQRRVDALTQLVEMFVFPLHHAASREDRRTWEQISDPRSQ